MEATKIKMNMDGTIRAKVLQYKSDGNTLIEKWETLKKYTEGVYYNLTPDNYGGEYCNIVLEINGVFWKNNITPGNVFCAGHYAHKRWDNEARTVVATFPDIVRKNSKLGKYINKLQIEVMRRLGHDVADLQASNDEYIRQQEERDRQRAEEAERRERERMEAEERRKAEVLADGKEKLMNHERITVEQIELIAEAVGYKINIRTIGFMREKVTGAAMSDNGVQVSGYKLTSRNIDGTAKVMHEIYDRIKAQVEEEAEQPATPTETPQISTEAAETVNVSVEGKKEAETKETPRCECPNYADYAFERGWSIENTDFDPHSGVLCMIHFDPSDEKYVCGCLWQINSDKPNYTEHRRFKTLKGAQNYGTKRMGMKLEYQTLTVNCSVTPSEPPQSLETPRAAQSLTSTDKRTQIA